LPIFDAYVYEICIICRVWHCAVNNFLRATYFIIRLRQPMTIAIALQQEIDRFFNKLSDLPLTAQITPGELARYLSSHYDFTAPTPIEVVFNDVARMLHDWNEHSNHPRHFGLFRPAVDQCSVAGDALAALYNTQLATWELSPVGNEIEKFTLDAIGRLFGFDPAAMHANFTNGGSEANQTAVVLALANAFPEFTTKGLRGLAAQPVMYVSEEAHNSFDKIARICGLGREALRIVPSDENLALDLRSLDDRLASDRSQGFEPFMVVGTAGTPNAGTVDPLQALAERCQAQRLWFHADAAWGGAAVFSSKLKTALAGIQSADSVTFDGHKWLSVSAGTGMFFCRHRDAVMRTFSTDAAYVPERSEDGRSYHYLTSLQWGRRFTGLKVFMLLASLGLAGVAERIEHQARLGEYLRQRLRDGGWELLNNTTLPVVCFTHPKIKSNQISLGGIIRELKINNQAWISSTLLRRKIPCLRACITNFRTHQDDVDALVGALNAVIQRTA
jgi:aromatic-L-amino-acid/L-tryptophan decarboxylase